MLCYKQPENDNTVKRFHSRGKFGRIKTSLKVAFYQTGVYVFKYQSFLVMMLWYMNMIP